MARLEIYWSFRSPYSYLAIDRLAAIKREYDVDIDFRPVRPLTMREPDFFKRGRKQFLPYLLKDAPREAERLGVPFGPPDPDPIRMDMASGKVDPEQPVMTMLMGLAVAATMTGAGIEFAQAVGRSIWGGKANWHEEAALAETVKQAGLDLSDLKDWAENNKARTEETIARNEARQLEHHWGVPLMVFDGEPFFGQDRIDSLIWRLDHRGLKRD